MVYLIFIGLIVRLVYYLAMSWLAMLLFGWIHAFWPAVPALGFFQAYLVLLLAQILTSQLDFNTDN